MSDDERDTPMQLALRIAIGIALLILIALCCRRKGDPIRPDEAAAYGDGPIQK